MCASCVHLWIKLLAQVEFSSSLNQTAEYLQMKGCTSKCLLLDTEGVIVSPSADLPFNGGLSDASHAKVCVAPLYFDGCAAEWPKCFTPAPNPRVAFTPARGGESRGLYKILPWMQFQCATVQMCKLCMNLLHRYVAMRGSHSAEHRLAALAALLFSNLPYPSHRKSVFFPFHFLPQQQATGTALKCRIIIP